MNYPLELIIMKKKSIVSVVNFLIVVNFLTYVAALKKKIERHV